MWDTRYAWDGFKSIITDRNGNASTANTLDATEALDQHPVGSGPGSLSQIRRRAWPVPMEELVRTFVDHLWDFLGLLALVV